MESNMDWNNATAFRVYEDGQLIIDENPERGDHLRPSTSETQSNSNDNEIEFQKRMETLSKMERKTAQAFLDRGIAKVYKWPIARETRNDMNLRKN